MNLLPRFPPIRVVIHQISHHPHFVNTTKLQCGPQAASQPRDYTHYGTFCHETSYDVRRSVCQRATHRMAVRCNDMMPKMLLPGSSVLSIIIPPEHIPPVVHACLPSLRSTSVISEAKWKAHPESMHNFFAFTSTFGR